MNQSTALKKLEEALAEHYGWAATPSARTKIHAAIASKARRLRIEHEEYCQIAATSQSEMLALVEEAAVGETYFFREPQQFNYLRATILPALLKARGPEEVVRIWSTACSTGEEAYSLAIACEQIRSPGDEQGCEIFATDVRNRALLEASQAHYSPPSLRELDAEARAKYFIQTGNSPEDPLSGTYTVTPALRRLVTFRRVNLLDRVFWKGVTQRFDLIVCTNLLLYLHGAAVRQMVARLSQALRPGGYLMVAPAECSLAEHPALRPLRECPSFFRRIP